MVDSSPLAVLSVKLNLLQAVGQNVCTDFDVENHKKICGFSHGQSSKHVHFRGMENTSNKQVRRFGYQLADPFYYAQLKTFAQRMRAMPTHAEMLLWNAVRGKKLCGQKFRRQHIIGRYITDLVCLTYRLIIEIDGLIHQLPENKQSDAERQEELEKMGFTVMRFTNAEIESALEKVLTAIKSYFEKQDSA